MNNTNDVNDDNYCVLACCTVNEYRTTTQTNNVRIDMNINIGVIVSLFENLRTSQKACAIC